MWILFYWRACSWDECLEVVWAFFQRHLGLWSPHVVRMDKRTAATVSLSLVFKGRPNHDHDHFWVHLVGPHFSFLGYPRMTHQMPLLHSRTQRTHKDFSSDVPPNAVLVWHQMQNFFGRLWLWLWLGRPWVFSNSLHFQLKMIKSCNCNCQNNKKEVSYFM